MNDILREYLAKVERYLDPRNSADTLAELRDLAESAAEEAARLAGRETAEDVDYRAALKKLGEPSAVATRYRVDRYLIGPANYGPFFGYLGLAFAIHLGLALFGAVFRVTLPIGNTAADNVQGVATWRALVEFLASLPSLFLFDFGLVTLVVWVLERRGLNLPFPTRLKAGIPKPGPAAAAIVLSLVFLAVLNGAPERIFRWWSTGIEGSLPLLGEGFYAGLPFLNIAILLGILTNLVFLAGLSRETKLVTALVDSFIWLICLGLFFSRPGILILPASLGLPADLGGAIAKGISVPTLLAATVEVARNVVALWQEKLG